MTTALIKNGRMVTAVDDYVADILVVDGRVRSIGTDLQTGEDVAVYDATDLLSGSVISILGVSYRRWILEILMASFMYQRCNTTRWTRSSGLKTCADRPIKKLNQL